MPNDIQFNTLQMIAASNARKQQIIKELELNKRELPMYVKPKFTANQEIQNLSFKSSFLEKNAISKEAMLKEIDMLKRENLILTTELSNKNDIEAKVAVLESELQDMKQKLQSATIQISNYAEAEKLWEIELKTLKRETEDLQVKMLNAATDKFGDISHGRKMDNSERFEIINQQQMLLLELENLKSEKEKYGDMIQNIEAASSSGKICIISSRGLVVTTMLDLAVEITGEKRK